MNKRTGSTIASRRVCGSRPLPLVTFAKKRKPHTLGVASRVSRPLPQLTSNSGACPARFPRRCMAPAAEFYCGTGVRTSFFVSAAACVEPAAYHGGDDCVATLRSRGKLITHRQRANPGSGQECVQVVCVYVTGAVVVFSSPLVYGVPSQPVALSLHTHSAPPQAESVNCGSP